MFNKKNKETETVEKKITSRNIIGEGTKIVGDIISDGDFRIDGELEGKLNTKGKVILGKQGVIKGDMECNNADIEGKINGKFIVHNILAAKSSAVISGEVTVGQISAEVGAVLNANCIMKGAVKDLNVETKKSKKEKTA